MKKEIFTGNSLAHTKWNCKYHIVFDTVKIIGELAFSECKNLKTVEMNDYLSVIENNAVIFCPSISECAFYNCESLEKISIKSRLYEWDIKWMSMQFESGFIGKEAFSGCAKLNSVSIEGKYNQIENKAFYNCDSLLNLILPKTVEYI